MSYIKAFYMEGRVFSNREKICFTFNRSNICFFKRPVSNILFISQLPPALYGQAVVLDKESDDFYTVGGTSGYNYYIDIHKINMRTKLWECVYKLRREEPLPHEPTPR
jgi:hypothetical protein